MEELDASVIINIHELQSLVTVSTSKSAFVFPNVCIEVLLSRVILPHGARGDSLLSRGLVHAATTRAVG